MAKDKPTDDLNSKTPQWFKDWHNKYFSQVRDRSLRNERVLWLVLGTILAASVIGEANLDLVSRIALAIGG